MKCPNCKKEIVKYPIRKQPDKSLADNYKQGTIIWKNLFKMDSMSLIFMIIILFSVWAYTHDIEQYKMIKDNSTEFCLGRGFIIPQDMQFQSNELLQPIAANLSIP